ncbi:DUF4303 domain-containing protein [Pseudoalteromonas piscicida]|uniref:DUF4303 domain-containing protein n=1 Tax=Pseudoalteromonas TaxID=53246 RepID=UPI001BAD9A5A|nr:MULTISPECIES: DUF4303 domain-containing protein [Pseudoalteromonas]QUI71412.1 DUF4303 domain-containing protein [Pseudoalteromonas sp. M8]UDM61261.1 DUF4303 domain-containing protein [Pseudoalteromonas piscicida]
MSDLIDFDKLKSLVKDAVKTTFTNLQRIHQPDELLGYALCTDDSVMTLYHVAMTQQWLSQDDNTEFEFSPVEWDLSDRDVHFKGVATLLAARLELEDAKLYENYLEEIINPTFKAFVLALLELRQEGVFAKNVFLSVISTDPSEHMLELESAANRKLNSAELLNRFNDWHARFG